MAGDYTPYSGQNGTGGLLILYADTLYNKGMISSNGSIGGSGQAGGGSSGGGSINIFANKIPVKGLTNVLGGASNGSYRGGAGGTGSTVSIQLKPDLNYPDKSILLNIGDTYKIDEGKLTLLSQNNKQTGILTLGEIEYEVLDSDIITKSQDGKITAKAEGKTKIKITDKDNDISTYIYVQVVNDVKIDVQEGKNFTVALKQNGTVWSYGLNTNGQLGIGNNDNQTEPVEVQGLDNIKQIATGYSHTLALTKNGEVYAWGLGAKGQLGNGENSDSNIPVKIDSISDIIKIDAYKNISIALDTNGNVYIWGENYSVLPMKVVFSQTIVDISGTLVLTTNGEVYNISDVSNITKIEDLSKIAKISAGEAHNLALDINGVTYAWGTNTYGECGATTGNITVTEITYNIYNISAGNQTSILQNEDGEVYVLGNNANGQIGLGTTAKATAPTKITLTEDVKIESISAGEGTHSGIIDTNGFVWHTGLNTYGELGIEANTKQTSFIKTGKPIIKVKNGDKIYLDLKESETIYATLENTFNLKIDLIDDDQTHFSLQMPEEQEVILANDKTLTGNEYGKTTVTVKHNTNEQTKDVEIIVAMKMKSIVQGFRDANLQDGEYSIVVNKQEYTVELINIYDENKVYAENTELGDESTEYKTLVVKYHGDLTINEGVTLTAKTVKGLTYKKGMYLCVLGNIYNNGTISMTARGTYNQEGEDVYLWKNIDNSYEYVPKDGGAGGKGITYAWTSRNSHDVAWYGEQGQNGENRATGGGGSGALYIRKNDYTGTRKSGSGSSGTSYSGGTGGGGNNSNYSGTHYAGDGAINGGKGGDAFAARGRTSYAVRNAGGGAGNVGGVGKYTAGGQTIAGNNASYSGQSGTGGLLIVYANILYNNGNISSNGSRGGSGLAGGGSSGGGSINIFAKQVNEFGIQSATGGLATGSYYGGTGGNGSVTVNELGSVLNYAKKTINLHEKEDYNIERAKLSYTKLNKIQTEDLTLGELNFETLDENIATVDAQGRITAVAVGKTKIRITDTTNKYSTYIIVNVTEEGLTTPQIEAGTDFTIALKANGTVWSFGNNKNGQLGNNTQEDSNEPVQVLINDSEVLEDIVDIGAGENSGIALNASGEVYTWGLNIKDIEEEIEQDSEITTQTVRHEENILTATKVEGLPKIEKVECYKNNFYAIDSEGHLYIWGDGYSGPTKVDTELLVDDITGKILLGQDGRVYKVEDLTTPINYVHGVYEISGKYEHYLMATVEGRIYSLGSGQQGQLGNRKNTNYNVPTLVKTETGYLEDVASISAGNNTSMAVTFDGEAYVWGDNTNKKLGISDAKIAYAKQVTQIQDNESTELELKPFEIVEAGNNSSYLADINGFVYSVGLNTKGQLGTEDNTNRTVFTKIGHEEIITKPGEINIPVGTTDNIAIALSNSFNLKTDIIDGVEVEPTSTNEKELSISRIQGVNNEHIKNIKDFANNYTITGNKIGRVNVVVTAGEGRKKNVWINVVDSENAKVSAKVVNGDKFTIALRSDGTVWGFGSINGESNPEKYELPEDIVDITAGRNHVILLGKSGGVYTFGTNANGQLGTGNVSTYKTPTKLNIADIKKVSAVENTSFAITSEGKVYAWGAGYGKSPVLLSMDENVIDIGSKYYLSEDGIVREVAGEHEEISLSLNQYDPAYEPELEEDKIMQISEGTDHILMLGKTGKVYSYGKNSYGQLGDGGIVDRLENISSAVKVEGGNILGNVIEVSAGDKYSIVVTDEHKVYTFGINEYGELGFNQDASSGGKAEYWNATLKEDIAEVERVSAGYNHTSVYKQNGEVYTFGQGENGELGNEEYFNYYTPQLVGKDDIQTNTSRIVIKKDDTFDVDAWIDYFNLFKEKEYEITYDTNDNQMILIDGDTGEFMAMKEGRATIVAKETGTEKIAVISVVVLENSNIEPMVETAGSHTVMLKVDGTVWTYGIGEHGELGDGSRNTSDEPVQVTFPAGTVITQVATGENHVLALDKNGNVWGWGRNDYYQLGTTNTSDVLKPTIIAGLTNIKKIACGMYNSFAVNEKGELYSFGLNANGEGGIGSYTNNIPVTKASNIKDIVDIRAGKNHTIILKSTGEVYVTGSNLYGELGQNDSSIRNTKTFVKVPELKNIVSVSAGISHCMALGLDGSVYTWGSNIYGELGLNNKSSYVGVPTKVSELSNIRYISGGKNYSLSLNKENELFVCGLNGNGELGNATKVNRSTFQKLDTIESVLGMSGGNTYTVMVKTDGTVWATGDYAHGDEEIKSKTRGSIPTQVGNDETGIEETEITIKVGETKNIGTNCSYQFNLIYLDQNFNDSLTFETLKDEIADVDEKGTVTGMRVGTTRVNVTSSENGRTYSVLVKVIQEDSLVAPRVSAGENFATVLKADGSVWSFGYNSDGRLGIGDYLTKDIPNKTNVLATYTDIKAGGDFILALRSDKTVWATGNNKRGQLGDGTNTSRNKLGQIVALSKITKIASGDDFGIALDEYGIVYKWGSGSSIPHAIEKINKKVIDISAGKKQIAYVTAKGTVEGIGDILDGEIDGVDNAVEVEVVNNKIVYLTTDGEVYEYSNGSKSKVEIGKKVIDISANNTSVMYQTVDEEIYVSGENTNMELGTGNADKVVTPVKVQAHGDKAFGMGAGYYNTYIIANDGNVYASGKNTYGSIGNGTRKDASTHTLVGDRKFEIEPIVATMQIADTEEIQILGNVFNVFNNKEKNKDEYNFEVDDEHIVSVTDGVIEALAEGIAHITVTDKETNEQIELTRIIIPAEKDRIEKITVNGEVANLIDTSTEDKLEYYVKIVTNDDTARLIVSTNDKTDKIRINEEDEWSEKGLLDKEIALTGKITDIPIKVAIENNNGEYNLFEDYILHIEKVTDDIGIKEITVTSKDEEGNEETIKATPVSLTKYEVAVEEYTDISKIIAKTNCEYSYISIDGLEYTQNIQETQVKLGTDSPIEVIISVKSEAETEAQYTLIIYKKNSILDLISLTVNDEEAVKLSETSYAVSIDKNCSLAKIKATLNNDLASVSIAGSEYKVRSNEKDMTINSDTTIVTITAITAEGESKEYTLTIYRDKEEAKELELDMVIVNGIVVEPNETGDTYIYYLPSAIEDVEIRAIAKDRNNWVQIESEEKAKGEATAIVQANNIENEYEVTLSDDEGESRTYTVIIRKAESDTSLEEVFATYEDREYKAEKVDDTNYRVKIPGNIEKIDVTAVTGYAKSKVYIGEDGTYKVHVDTENVTINGDETVVKIFVESENGEYHAEYTLTIVKMSNNTKLLSVEVDGTEATLDDNGIYHYTLTDPTTSVIVKAITKDSAPKEAYVNIDNSEYALYEISKQVNITQKETEVKIKVKAEDGTTEVHTLIIEGLSDDVTIQKVVVNGKEATYIEGKNRYEIRDSSDEYEVEVTLNEKLASLILGTNPEAHGSDTITVSKSTEGTETIVEVVVKSYSGFVTEKYTIVIQEKSDNVNLDVVRVNGNNVTQDLEGNYVAKLPHETTKINIEAIAEDTYATTTIDNNDNSSYIATLEKQVVDGQTEYVYTIKVVSETGKEQTYTLKVIILEANFNITDVLVGEDETSLNQAEYMVEGEHAGKYYYKIKRVDKATVKVELESSKSRVRINGKDGDTVEVALEEDITEVPIIVIAEDGTEKETYLVIEKESSDTSIVSITGEGVIRTELYETEAYVYVDEDLSKVDLLITLNNELAKLKVKAEEGAVDPEFTLHEITKEVVFSESNEVFTVVVEAEDGTQAEYTITVCKEADLDLLSVEVNSEMIEYDEEDEEYFALVPNGIQGNIVIKAHKQNQTVQLFREDGTTKITEAVGTLSTTQTLSTSLTDNYVIKVVSHNGENVGSKEYKLRIRQKSKEDGIIYVKVDGSGTIVSSDGLQFSATVAGKDIYPVEIKLKDEKAKVRIESEEGQVLVEDQTYILQGELAVADDENRFNVIVTSENGDEKTYTLIISRISSKVKIDSITVTDYDEAKENIKEKEVTEYDEETKTYRVYVSNLLENTTIKVKTSSVNAIIKLDNKVSGNNEVSYIKGLPKLGITKVLMELTAGDGTEETRYLEIIQLPSETGIERVTVDENDLTRQEEEPDYKATVHGKESYPVEIELTDELAKVRIEDEEGNIVIPDSVGVLSDSLKVPDGEVKQFTIVVTAQDGTEERYTLEVERISSNTEIESITVTDYGETKDTMITRTVKNYDKETKTYKIVVNNELPNSQVTITTVSDKATITIDSGENNTKTVTFDRNLNGIGITRITFTVKAADGTEEERYLEIIKLSDEIGIKKVEVDGVEVPQNESGDYEHTVTDKEDLSSIYVELKDNTSKVSINKQNEAYEKTTLQVSKGNNRQLRITIEVTAEDETTYTYTLILNIISSNTKVQSVTVNDESAEYKEDEKVYIAYIDKYATEAKVVVIPAVEYSTVTHEDLSNVGRLEFTINTEDLTEDTFETTFKVTAEDGESFEEYNLRCIRKSEDASIKIVYIDEEEVPENKSHAIYADGTYYKATVKSQAKVKVVANSEFAKVSFNEQVGVKELEQTITLDTSKKVTEIPVTITSQQGNTQSTVIYIEKISNDCSLEYVKVNKKTIEEKTDEPKTYLAYVYSTAESAKIEIEAKEKNATIVRVTKDGQEFTDDAGNTFKGTPYLDMNVDTNGEAITEVYFKVVAEDGSESEIYKIILQDMSADNSLKEVWVEGELIQPRDDGNYVARVLDTLSAVKVKAVTTSELAEVRISFGEFKKQIDEKTTALTEDITTTIPITVRSQAGASKVVYLYVNKISTNVEIDVKLDTKDPDYYDESTHTYTFLIGHDKEEYEMSVLAKNNYTQLEYESEKLGSAFNKMVQVESEVEGKTFKVKATSESGAEQEYTINIVHISDNTNLEYVKVNEIEREPDEEGGDTYTVIIPKDATSATIEVQTQYSYANVRIGDEKEARQHSKAVIECKDLNEKQIVVPVKVTAADGKNIRTYFVVLVRDNSVYLTGKILTENVKEEYISEVVVYKMGEPKEEIARAVTEKDGTYRIRVYTDGLELPQMLLEKYEVVVTKAGYLSYTITDITLIKDEEMDLGEHKLLAGDVVQDGEIELDDLVNLNANLNTNLETTIDEENTEEKAMYDFNEDGTIDMTDRKILQKNYGKKAEVEEWVNPISAMVMSTNICPICGKPYEITASGVGAHCMCPTGTFSLPLASEYKISSQYGERENPVTGEEKLHAGIDLVGEHHGEILSIADGVVTYAGVQNGYGNCIEIKHIVNGETIYSFYAHLSEIDVKVGEKVNKGAVIGLEGGAETDPNHGTSTGHHLHFEIRTASGSGHSIAPTKYIQF